MLTQALFIPHGLPHYCANTAGLLGCAPPIVQWPLPMKVSANMSVCAQSMHYIAQSMHYIVHLGGMLESVPDTSHGPSE